MSTMLTKEYIQSVIERENLVVRNCKGPNFSTI